MAPHVTSLTQPELAAILGSAARVAPALRAIHDSIDLHRLPDRADGVAAQAWVALRASYGFPAHQVVDRRVSNDGTVGLTVAFEDALVETVVIPSRKRTTVCVSSQAGCTRSCSFCATGRLGFERNLDAGEIVLQVLLARAEATSAGHAPCDNVVFMGMGEPLDNLEQVVRAIDVLTALPRPGVPARRITVSTSGVLPAMTRFLEGSPAELALSLHATRDEDRARLVPHGRSWSIRDLLGEVARALEGDSRVLFVEYMLIAGVNDSDDDAERLVRLLDDVPSRVNLIPYNGVPSSSFDAPHEARLAAFAARLHESGVRCIVRRARGRDIRAACGQLVASR